MDGNRSFPARESASHSATAGSSGPWVANSERESEDAVWYEPGLASLVVRKAEADQGAIVDPPPCRPQPNDAYPERDSADGSWDEPRLAPASPAGHDAAGEQLPAAGSDTAHTAQRLDAAEIKSRAVSGVALILGRGVLFRVLGLGGNLVLARLLTPRDFGYVALGLTIISLGQFLAGAGLGTALITRDEAPSREELRAVMGLQLVVTSAVGLVAAFLASVVSHSALVTAFMMLALPLTAFRTPVMLLLQRQLSFNLTVRVEIVEVLVYLVWAIVAASMGFGAWALATATVARVAAGTLVAATVSPAGVMLPSARFSSIRGILGFGARFQATDLVQLGQDTATTAMIASLGGISDLGYWSFASRFTQVPFMLFEAMWGVGVPAFSRLLQAGERAQMSRLLERTVAATALGVAAIMCPLCAASPALVPYVFGHTWAPVSLIIPGSAIALVVFGPISISGYGYLYAAGDASTPFKGTVAATVVRLVSMALLLPVIGVAAIGLAWALSCVAEVPLVLGRIHDLIGARLVRPVVRPSLIASIGAAAGWAVSDLLGPTLLGVGCSLSLSVGLFALLAWTLARQDLLDTSSFLQKAYRARRRRSDPPPNTTMADQPGVSAEIPATA